jgi:hypothetical protein
MIAEREKDLVAGKRGKTGTPKGENLINWQIARRIFLDHPSDRRRAVTYELPLSAHKQGQLKADVVVFNAKGLVEIVELKRTGSRGTPDSPLMALVEGICYTLQMLRCWPCLSGELTRCRRPDGLPRRINIVLAGPEYWDHCHGNGKRIADDEIADLNTVVECVSQVVRRQRAVPNPAVTLTLASVEGDRLVSHGSMRHCPVPPGSIVDT